MVKEFEQDLEVLYEKSPLPHSPDVKEIEKLTIKITKEFLGETIAGATFDGRYVYYVPYSSDTFARYNTQVGSRVCN